MMIPETVPERPRSTTSAEATLRADLARVVGGQDPAGPVRAEILESWRRSFAFGVRPDRHVPPSSGPADPASPLARAGAPVVARLGTDLDGTSISVVLADDAGRIVARHAGNRLEEAQLDRLKLACGYRWALESTGTNGLADALDARSARLVAGGEHFADALAATASAGAPIVDPRTFRVVGALALVCPAESANALLVPTTRRAAREVEVRLVHGTSAVERILEAQFLRARRRARGPVAHVSPSGLLANAAAARLLRPGDRDELWRLARRSLTPGAPAGSNYRAVGGAELTATFEPVCDGDQVVGVLVALTSRAAADPAPRPSLRRTRSGPLAIGWDSLTATERGVTELVAQGLTNRQVAAQLFMSPHTVDSHLRHIFAKLDINSRVELARIFSVR